MSGGKSVAFLLGTCLALVALCAFLGLRLNARGNLSAADLQALLDDPEVRADVVERLVQENKSIFDSHPDAEVGRILNPGMRGVNWSGVPIDTNGWGMREKEYELPKPEGVVRVVFVGDSFVFGFGVAVEDRMGALLEGYLREHSPGYRGRIECLHLGVPSWNAVAEMEFVRRQLSELRPDLVCQLIIASDLEDASGVRGFGAMSSFNPRERQRGDALVLWTFPSEYSVPGNRSYLLDGVDRESRMRYEELVERAARLSRAVRAAGGRYLLIANWDHFSAKLHRFLGEALPEDEVLFLPKEFRTQKEYWIKPDDSHWNRKGHDLFALTLYGVIRGRGLLPSLGLQPWPDAQALSDRIVARGNREASDPRPEEYWGSGRPVLSKLDFRRPTPELMRHVYTGLTHEGVLYPYASVLIRNPGGGKLRVRGEFLGRPELVGGRAQVYAEEERLGEIVFEAEGAFEKTWSLPDGLAQREFLNLRFESDDWVYTGPKRRNCRSLRLIEIEIAAP